MRIESSVTSVSWIPSEAVSGPMKMGFAMGMSHYDASPPAHLTDVQGMRDADAFRFANELRAWAEFEDGQPVAFGQTGGLVMGATTVRMGKLDATFAAVPMPDLRDEPVVADGLVRFTQTVGGRTALPMPRITGRAPFLRIQSPLVWTTLRLTLHADGTTERELTSASPFPRHWVYDDAGDLTLKAGLAEWRKWLGQPSWTATPWGNETSPVLVAEVETALERELSALLMHNAGKPVIGKLAAGDVLARQGDQGTDLFLVLDGLLQVDVDGRALGTLGPGAVVGEHAILTSGPRTATLTALTAVKVARAPADVVDRDALAELASGHRRELADS